MEDMVRSVAQANRPRSNSNESHVNEDELGELKGYDFGFRQSRNFLKQLAKDNIDITLLETEMKKHKTGKQRKLWYEAVLFIMHSNIFQIILSILVLLDAGIVISEIVLEIQSLQLSKEKLSSQVERAIHLFQKANSSVKGVNKTEEDHSDHNDPWKVISKAESILRYVEKTSNYFTCTKEDISRIYKRSIAKDLDFEQWEEHYPKRLHHASEILHYTSVFITSLFLLLVIIKIIILKKKFLRDRNEVIDSLIIVISFVSDIVYIEYASFQIATIVILLIWRVIRIINALMMHEKQRYEFRIALQKKARRIQQQRIELLETDKEMLEKHIIALEELSRELGCSEDTIKKCKPRFKKYSKEQTNNALKSIAALTTGFMGNLVGAQSAISKISNAQNENTSSKSKRGSPSDRQRKNSFQTNGFYKKFTSDKTIELRIDSELQTSLIQNPTKFFKSKYSHGSNRERLKKSTSVECTTYPDIEDEMSYCLNPRRSIDSISNSMMENNSSKLCVNNLYPSTILESRRESYEARNQRKTNEDVYHINIHDLSSEDVPESCTPVVNPILKEDRV